jgi:hypothetical protein
MPRASGKFDVFMLILSSSSRLVNIHDERRKLKSNTRSFMRLKRSVELYRGRFAWSVGRVV